MVVRKASKARENDPKLGIHSRVSLVLSIIAIAVMGYLGIRHYGGLGYEAAWGKYALSQSAFGLMGLFGTQFLRGGKITHYKDFDINTGFYAMITLVAAMITQVASRFVLSIDTTEQALYYVFSSVCEELFFRLFLIEVFLMLAAKRDLGSKLLGVLLSAVGFAAFHQNYYGDVGLLIGVFLGGVVFGVAYILTNNITVPILAHFALNIIATGNWLVTLSGQFAIIVLVITILAGVALCICMKRTEPRRLSIGQAMKILLIIAAMILTISVIVNIDLKLIVPLPGE